MSVAVRARCDRGETDIGLAVEGGLPLFDVPSRFGVQATHPLVVDNPSTHLTWSTS